MPLIPPMPLGHDATPCVRLRSRGSRLSVMGVGGSAGRGLVGQLTKFLGLAAGSRNWVTRSNRLPTDSQPLVHMLPDQQSQRFH